MARLARLTLPGQLHLITHCGNNKQPVVIDDADRQTLLDLLCEQAARHRVAMHAYVLLPASLYLLLTPVTADGVPSMMQAVGRAYVRYFNARHGRSGTLWEGRYRSTLIQPERYLLPCMALMDTEPVRAGLCGDPASWAWSSHGHHIGRVTERRLSTHPLYWALGNTPFAREAAYAEMVHRGLGMQQMGAILDAVWHGWVLGEPAFIDAMQRDTARRLQPARPGRPRKSVSVD
jgi:putative transposase